MWERKFELDSSAYFLNFLWNYHQVRYSVNQVRCGPLSSHAPSSMSHQSTPRVPGGPSFQRFYLPQPLAPSC